MQGTCQRLRIVWELPESRGSCSLPEYAERSRSTAGAKGGLRISALPARKKEIATVATSITSKKYSSQTPAIAARAFSPVSLSQELNHPIQPAPAATLATETRGVSRSPGWLFCTPSTHPHTHTLHKPATYALWRFYSTRPYPPPPPPPPPPEFRLLTPEQSSQSIC